jgi:hypothetical protein
LQPDAASPIHFDSPALITKLRYLFGSDGGNLSDWGVKKARQ